ncbi:hypothetical protein [Mycobacterium sp. OTB74]|uniref:DUF7159 family protein n=1 Tax=Mycobacterium sp. OTB74 TaxID=1853452 RepID=UPI00247332BB|nr:hypothetical protein [Mycobacterium sp. OTB74]
MTPNTVRMALVEGDKADGAIVDHDIFETSSDPAAATPVDQVVGAILGTRESAEEGGHKLASIGVAWSDHDEAAQLRDALDAAGVKDVMMVSELHAASALAQAAGQSVGYNSTGLLFVDRDTATASVVEADGAISKVLSRSLHSADAMAVFSEMASAIAQRETPPGGMFVVGSGVDVTAVQEHLAHLVDIPVSAPDDAELALARGAALASASAPIFDAATAGLAYSMAPAGAAAAFGAAAYGSADGPLADPMLTADEFGFDELGDAPVGTDQDRKPFLLVGSALTSIFVVGVVALAISLAVSIRPTVDERPAPAQAAIVPSAPLAAPAPPPAAVVPAPAPAAPPPAAVETLNAPPPAAHEAPAPEVAPHTVYVAPPEAKAPAPEAPPPAPAPEAPAPVQAPVPVSMPGPVAPAPVAPVLAPPLVLPPGLTAVPPPSQRYGPGWSQGPPQSAWQQGDSDEGYPGNRYPGRYGDGYQGNNGYPNGRYPGGQYPGGGYPGNPYPGGHGPKACFLIFCKGD